MSEIPEEMVTDTARALHYLKEPYFLPWEARKDSDRQPFIDAARAALLAAGVPALLAALAEIVEYIDGEVGGWDGCCDIARAALAKAGQRV